VVLLDTAPALCEMWSAAKSCSVVLFMGLASQVMLLDTAPALCVRCAMGVALQVILIDIDRHRRTESLLRNTRAAVQMMFINSLH